MVDEKNIKTWVFSIIVLLMGLGALGVSLAVDDSEKIETINAQWIKAFEQRDFQSMQALFTPDSLLLSPNEPAVEGSEAVAEVWKSWADFNNVAFAWSTNRIDVSSSGDMAYDYGWYTFTFDSEGGRVENKGNHIVVWKKIDGTWKVAADIFNNDLPLPSK